MIARTYFHKFYLSVLFLGFTFFSNLTLAAVIPPNIEEWIEEPPSLTTTGAFEIGFKYENDGLSAQNTPTTVYLDREKDASGTWEVAMSWAWVGRTYRHNETLEESGTYRYRVRGCNSAGCRIPTSSSHYVSTVADLPPTAQGSDGQDPSEGLPVLSSVANSLALTNYSSSSVATSYHKEQMDRVLVSTGDFNVSASGAATYTYPIFTPKGSAGLTPEMNVSYSSQSGAGTLGMGWSLSGTSAITRCRQTEQQDKQMRPISWDANDRFCLNGVRLIKLNDGSYRPENNNSIRVTRVGSASAPDYFKVSRPDGSLAYLGESGSSNSEWKGLDQPYGNAQSSRVYAWKLSRLEDLHGNKIVYEYFQSSTGQVLDKIYYGYSQSGQWRYKIDINYKNRKDYKGSFISGVYFPNYKIIDEILVSNSGNENIRTYAFTYNEGHSKNDVDRLTRINECVETDGNTTCLDPVIFDWTLPQTGFNSLSQTFDLSPRSGNYFLQQLHYGDFNGDGASDLLMLTSDTRMTYALSRNGQFEHASYSNGSQYVQLHHVTNSGTNPTNQVIQITIGDYNGDGRDDVFVIDTADYLLYLAEVSANGEWKLSNQPIQLDLNEADNLMLSDVNGDGLVDFLRRGGKPLYKAPSVPYENIYHREMESNPTQVAQGMPHKFAEKSDAKYYAILHSQGDGTYVDAYPDVNVVGTTRGTADFNGDGVPDYMLESPGKGTYTCSKNSSGRYSGSNCLYKNIRVPYIKKYIDDLSILPSGFSAGEYYVPYGEEDLSDEFWTSSQFRFEDLNRDGLTDILFLHDIWVADLEGTKGIINVGGGAWYYVLNNGSGFSNQQLLVDVPGDNSSSLMITDSLTRHDMNVNLEDIDQDGFADFIYFDFQDTRVIEDDGHYETGRFKIRYWNKATNSFGNPVDFCPKGASDCDFTYKHFAYNDFGSGSRKTTIQITKEICTLINGQSHCSGGTSISVAFPDGYTSWDYIKDTHFLDVNGDGKSDFIHFERQDRGGSNRDEIKIYRAKSASSPENVIHTISEPNGREITIDHDRLGGSSRYASISYNQNTSCTTTNTCWHDKFNLNSKSAFYSALSDPFSDVSGHSLSDLSYIRELNSGALPIVRRTEVSAPSAHGGTAGSINQNAVLAHEYFYAQAKLQAEGRGQLGFKYRMVVNDFTNVKTLTEYRQDWPFIGMVANEQVLSNGDHLISQTENEWRLYGWNNAMPSQAKNSGTASLGNGAYTLMPYLYQKETNNYALEQNGSSAGSLMSRTVNQVTNVDEFGNPLNELTITYDPQNSEIARKSRARIYGPSDEDKRFGRMTRLTVTDNHDGHQVTRTSAFTYLNGVVETETIEPDDNNYKLTTTHFYDSFGNRTHSTAADANGATRYGERLVFDTYGIFPNDTYDRIATGANNTLPSERLMQRVMSRDKFGNTTQVRTWVDATRYVTSESASTNFGAIYYMESGLGGYTKQMYVPEQGVQCPTGTRYHSTSTDASGASTLECFDVIDRSLRVGTRSFNGTWSFVDQEYDRMGRVLRKSEPYFSGGTRYWTSFYYDLVGREIQQVHPAFGTTHTNYEWTNSHSSSYVKTETNSLNQEKKHYYDAIGQLRRAEDDNNFGIDYRYDANGKLRTATNDDNVTITTVHDRLGRKSSLSDPNIGSETYTYYAFGDLKTSTNALNHVTTRYYDFKGRLIRQSASGNGTASRTWEHDLGAGAWNKVNRTEATDGNTIRKNFSFDTLGRVSQTHTQHVIAGLSTSNHYENMTYDALGRVYRVFDAARAGSSLNGNIIEYRYNNYGYQSQWAELSPNGNTENIYYTINATDARNSVTSASLGDGVIQHAASYYPKTGLMHTQSASSNTMLIHGLIQDRTYQWDSAGNMDWRDDDSLRTAGNSFTSRNLFEDFSYDNLNRLTSYVVSGNATHSHSIQYYNNGNIKFKTGLGYYAYNSTGPNRVTGAGGITYNYNTLGQLTTDTRGRTLTYDLWNNIKIIHGNSKTTEYSYTADNKKAYRKDIVAGDTTHTHFIGSVEKVQYADGSVEWKRYIGDFAVVTQAFPSTSLTSVTVNKHFLLRDHLGSVSHIVDAGGSLLRTMDFDPWGQRRNTSTWSELSSIDVELDYFKEAKPKTSKGFTGHEMIDEHGLIHMNGRTYDPLIARFIQADPIIQDPTHTQSFNRYSYVWNNPLNAVDPSGFVKKPTGHQGEEKVTVTGHEQDRYNEKFDFFDDSFFENVMQDLLGTSVSNDVLGYSNSAQSINTGTGGSYQRDWKEAVSRSPDSQSEEGLRPRDLVDKVAEGRSIDGSAVQRTRDEDIRAKVVLRRSTVPLKVITKWTTSSSMNSLFSFSGEAVLKLEGDVPNCCKVSIDTVFINKAIDDLSDPREHLPIIKHTVGGTETTKISTFTYSPNPDAGPTCFTCDAINIKEAPPIFNPGAANTVSDFIDNWTEVYSK